MKFVTYLGAALLALMSATAHAKDLKVVASIKPVHSLAAAVMAGAGTPELIVKGNASEHIYALRPSEAKAIANADLVIWIGPVMESFLIRPFSSLSEGHLLTLIDLEKLTRLPFRSGGPFEPDEHEGEDHDEHEEGAFDGHIWLDPQNAVLIVEALEQALSARDGEHAALYAANAKSEIARLKALDAELAQSLGALKGKPFIVFHDAYHYLEHRYGLEAVGSVTVNPDVPASAKRVSELKHRIVAQGALCLFSEPQFDSKLIESLKEGTNARSGVLDPLGASIAPGPEHYFPLMHALADALTGCLGK